MKKTVLALAIGCIALAGCSGVRSELGLGRYSPDEFTVVKRAPLSLPPEYDLLPPNPGAKRLDDHQTVKQAERIIFGEEEEVKEQDADSWLLSRMGANEADPSIRETLDKEKGFVPLEDKSVVEKVIFWDGSEQTESIIDASEEYKRLKTNEEEGRPINEGNVPVIERQQSTIDKIF